MSGGAEPVGVPPVSSWMARHAVSWSSSTARRLYPERWAVWSSEWPSSSRSTTTSRSGSLSRATAATTSPAASAAPRDPWRWARASRVMAVSQAAASPSVPVPAGSQPMAAWKTWAVSSAVSVGLPVQARR